MRQESSPGDTARQARFGARAGIGGGGRSVDGRGLLLLALGRERGSYFCAAHKECANGVLKTSMG